MRLALVLLAASAAVARAGEGRDHIDEARVLYRDVACGGAPAPRPSAHCAEMLRIYDLYRQKWLVPASAFLGKLVPAGLPAQVVYPFGGGDLVTALATFPQATEFTTISLEPAGDVRNSAALELPRLRKDLKNLFSVAHSKTVNLDDEAHGALPGQIVFALAALAVHGYEPTSLRYFHLTPEGSVAYDDEATPDVELRFQRAGEGEKILRHIAQNLDDAHLKSAPALLRHLEAKGKVAAMTKAASHLLWIDSFSLIRNYLISNMIWMISDSTGVPPRLARAAGFVQDTYGAFDGPAAFGTPNARDGGDLAALFKKHPRSELPFRSYGYPDIHRHGHIVVTRKP